jgi:hypothetical protein
MHGELTLDTPVGAQQFDFSSSGRVPLVRAVTGAAGTR